MCRGKAAAQRILLTQPAKSELLPLLPLLPLMMMMMMMMMMRNVGFAETFSGFPAGNIGFAETFLGFHGFLRDSQVFRPGTTSPGAYG